MADGELSERDRTLTEEQAERLWKRAAELQAEAARRLEERAHGEAAEGAAEEAERAAPARGYRLEHVRQAAVEAGIGEEFVRRALAEIEVSGTDVAVRPSDRLADRFLGPGEREMRVSRVFPAPAERVYAILQEVMTSSAYGLRLRDSRGAHPVDGGLLIFEVPSASLGHAQTAFAVALSMWADVKEVALTMAPADAEGRTTEVTLIAPLSHARRMNLWVGGGLVGMFSAVPAAMAAGVGGALLAPALGPVLTLLVAIGLGVGTLAGTGAVLTQLYRPAYRWGIGKGRAALEGLLGEVGVRIRLGGDFRLRAGQE